MFSPEVLGCLPMAHRRQSTSWMVPIFSSSFFFSGSLVAIVTSSPVSVLRTDFTWEFFHRSIPELWSSLVQFVLIKLSKFLKTYREKNMEIRAFLLLRNCAHFKIRIDYLCCGSHSCLSYDEWCFGSQGGKDACHLDCNITCTHHHTAPIGKTKLWTIDTTSNMV